ncbi:MAG: recombinase family protein, partial [Desulfobulbia bacterium]
MAYVVTHCYRYQWHMQAKPMTLVGYARTSTTDQKASLEAQVRDLNNIGCKEVFSEEISSVATKRPKLDECLRFLRKG